MTVRNENGQRHDEYVLRLEQIRRLSTPSLEGIPDAGLYSDLLRDNFIQIGRLASENRRFIEQGLLPVLRSLHPLSGEETRGLVALGDNLISAADAENLDLPIMALVSERLLRDAAEQDDGAALIRRLDLRMDTCYALMSATGRAGMRSPISARVRAEGLEIGRRLQEYMEPERFTALDAESRAIVLTDARYMSVFFEGAARDEALQDRALAHLDAMLALCEDPFYLRSLPDFNWRYFRYRTLDYYARLTDLGNALGFPPDRLARICDQTEAFAALWRSDPAYYSRFDSEEQVRLLLARNRFLAGRMSPEACRDELLALYRRRDPSRYDLNGIYDNLQIPAEAVCLLGQDPGFGIAPQQLDTFYRDMVRYAFHMPNSGGLSSMLEYYIEIVDRFVEVPGGLTFEQMLLNCLAALHPPTYIHSVMVSRIAVCLCRRLIDREPEWFVGTPGCACEADVRDRRDAILEFTRHAALCHDFGKLSIIDTIFVYGRNLFDLEYELIRDHPAIGARMLNRYDGTRPYADVALGHHRWYDNSGGYPDDFDPTTSPIWPFIGLVQCADCLDAATDAVGRSYSGGKTLEEFIAEVLPACGTHYPPWLAGLLSDEETVRELRDLLREGRRDAYGSTYELLREMGDVRSTD